jgi:hypothetical protein
LTPHQIVLTKGENLECPHCAEKRAYPISQGYVYCGGCQRLVYETEKDKKNGVLVVFLGSFIPASNKKLVEVPA